MSEVQLKNCFIPYEYKTIKVKNNYELLCLDCYKNFGWMQAEESADYNKYSKTAILHFKRNKNIANKELINLLQKECDDAIENMQILEKVKTSKARILAYTAGLIGTALMAGATFAYLGERLLLCIILAIPAFTLWGTSYIIYNNIKQKVTAKINLLIDAQFDNIHKSCNQVQIYLHKNDKPLEAKCE